MGESVINQPQRRRHDIIEEIIRTIANSRTYQLSSHAHPANAVDEKYFSHALVKRKRLTAELLLDASCAASGAPASNFALAAASARVPRRVGSGGSAAARSRGVDRRRGDRQQQQQRVQPSSILKLGARPPNERRRRDW